jgi:hypothetical protein
VSREARSSARGPEYGSGRKMPDSVTESPALRLRVRLPRRCTMRLRGVEPWGTCGQPWVGLGGDERGASSQA